jgi:hypothetical protein
MLAGPRGEMMRIPHLACRIGGARVLLSGGIKCGLSCWDGGVLVVAVDRADWRTRWDEPAGGCAIVCC